MLGSRGGSLEGIIYDTNCGFIRELTEISYSFERQSILLGSILFTAQTLKAAGLPRTL